MRDYERQLFSGKCPYTGEACDTDIDCLDCGCEKEERELMQEEGEEQTE